jgi:hypothetical protein|tara:strand:- start:699 stop:1475 length:777 start_codon:yes stop_codon:yes gene_type:complete
MLATEQAMPAEKFRLSVKITAGILFLVAVAGLFETAARVVFTYREVIRSNPVFSGLIQRSLNLDPYEMPSPHGVYHWVLRPGYKATQEKLVAQKKKAGRDLGAGVLQADVNDPGGKRKTVSRINADGFKGPELDKTHVRPRILALGDSITFGIGARDYPRRLEAGLNRRGIPVELVNGGVEGYSPHNLLYEIERYNTALRALAFRRRLGLIDLEKWSVQALQPRESFFSDSVHLMARGLDMVGTFMADQLANPVLKSR